jgi:hypothetical protein
MTSAIEIRMHLQKWLDGAISFRHFEEWFVPVAGVVAAENNPEAEALVDDIDMSLSEYSDGVLSSVELREELTRIARPFGPQIVSIDSYSPAEPYVMSKPQNVDFPQSTRKPPGMEQSSRVEDWRIEFRRGSL